MPKAKLYQSNSTELFKISRTGVQLFLDCPRCFYLKNKLGISQISGPPFTLNTAVNDLLVKEFDYYRHKKEPHPLLIENNIDAIPFNHENINQWRHNFTGVQYKDLEHNFLLYGAIDDVWIHNQTHELIIADYKATAKDTEVSLDADWQISYKNQVEFYQWLMRKNGFDVQDESYFVYCNGNKTEKRFDNTLTFRISLLPHSGNGHWIEPTLDKIKDCLESDKIPTYTDGCKHCNFVKTNFDLYKKLLNESRA
jgi:hypothetical protein